MQLWRKIAGFLTEPAQKLEDPVGRGAARLLSACLLFMALAFGALDVTLTHLQPGYAVPYPGYALLLVSYALSRTALHRFGAILATAMFPLMGLVQVLSGAGESVSDSAFGPILFSLIGPFFAGVFFGVRGSVVIAAVNLAWLILAGVTSFQRFSPVELVFPAVANLVAGVIAVLYAMHRDWVETQRREELAQREQQLQRMQTMEALGRLAGGIAHDFNNLLTVISGAASLLDDDETHDEVQLIESAVDSAQELTSQLLSLSKQGLVEHAVTDLRKFLDGTHRFLARIIGEDVEVSVHVETDLPAVALPAGKLQQILLNLGTNARDAMPEGGLLQVFAQRHDAETVLLSITDSGSGMDSETQRRIFEPFFTTKEEGKGTGLGLAMVFGIVSQYGGRVEVESEPDLGTTFHLYLPRAEQSDDLARSHHRIALSSNHEGTILVVEDSAQVREVCRVALRRGGFEVFEAAGPQEALELFDDEAERIDLVVSDVVMPGMRGPMMVTRMREKKPSLRVLFISGYAPEDSGTSPLDGDFLSKPFSPAELLGRVRRSLGSLDSVRPPATARPDS